MRSIRMAWNAVSAAAVAACLATVPAEAKESIRLAYVMEALAHSMLYAIETGKVTSDRIEVKIDFLGINAIDAAASTRQYDAVQISSLAIPRAALQGVPLKAIAVTTRYTSDSEILNIWVPSQSPYRTIADLKGKTIAAFGLNSSSLNNIRLAIAKKHGLNPSYDAGDFKWVEVPSTAMAAALQTGRVDAGTFLLTQAYQYGKSGEFRVVMNAIKDLHEVFGAKLPSGMLASYTDRLETKPDLYLELLRLLRASVAYLRANEGEVFGAMALRYKQTPEDVRTGFFSSERDFELTEADYKALGLTWQGYKDIGILREIPPVDALVWRPAIVGR